MVNLGLLPNCTKDNMHKCETCVESKFASKSYKSVIKRSNELLELIHTDLGDFKSIPSRGGKNYYITFIDDSSRYCYVYLIHSKDESLSMFKTYKAEVENQLDKKIKILRSDRGGEYESNAFAESVFGKQSPGPGHCDPLCEEAPLLSKLRGYFAEFVLLME